MLYRLEYLMIRKETYTIKMVSCWKRYNKMDIYLWTIKPTFDWGWTKEKLLEVKWTCLLETYIYTTERDKSIRITGARKVDEILKNISWLLVWLALCLHLKILKIMLVQWRHANSTLDSFPAVHVTSFLSRNRCNIDLGFKYHFDLENQSWVLLHVNLGRLWINCSEC